MAKQDKTLPARRQHPAVDDTALIRSAESLGRMIGSLQRQLEGVSKKLPLTGSAAALLSTDGSEAGHRKGTSKMAAPARKAATGRASKGGSKSGAKKTQSTADRKSKRASKSASAKKTAGRSRSGASRTAAKSSRRQS